VRPLFGYEKIVLSSKTAIRAIGIKEKGLASKKRKGGIDRKSQ